MTKYVSPKFQINDADGKPVVGAKKYLFEPGTSTLKTIYSDAELTLSIENPAESNEFGEFPDIYLDGLYREVQHDDKGVLRWDSDIGTVDEGQFQLWSISETYNIPDIVYGSDDEFYRSLTDSNVANNPTVSPAAWEVVKFIQVWNTNVTYVLNQHAYGSDGELYASLEASNFGNDPTGSGGKWEFVSVDNKWSNVSSDATTDLGAATGHYGNITGSTTITSFGVAKAGTRKTATFTNSSLTITYNATSMILPGNANIIAQPGDVAELISLGSGNWVMTSFQVDSKNPLNPYRGALAYSSIALTIPTSSNTVLLLDSESYDTDSIHSTSANTSRLTVPTGVTKIILRGFARFVTNSTGTRSASILKNGTVTLNPGSPIIFIPAPSGSESLLIVTAVIPVSGGDYYEFQVSQSSGGNLDIAAPSPGGGAYFSMEIIE